MGSGDTTVDKIIESHYNQVTCLAGAPAFAGAQCFISKKPYRSGTITFKNTFSDYLRTVEALYNYVDEHGPIDPSIAPMALVAGLVVAREDSLLKAAGYMVVDMKVDLETYFGIVAVVKTTASSVCLYMSMTEEEEERRSRPIIDTIKASKGPNETGADLSKRVERWAIGRERIMQAFTADTVVKLATQTPGRASRALPLAATEAGPFGDYLLNPFTWRTSDGMRAMITDGSRDHGRGAYAGRAAICMSATAILVHELGHSKGCMILEADRCKGYAQITGGDAPPPAFEDDNATDVDLALGAHPHIAKRVKGKGIPNFRTYLDHDVKNETISSIPEPGRTWFEMPSERVLRTGKLEAGSIGQQSKEQEIMDFIGARKGKPMAFLLSEFATLRNKKGYDRLNEMRGWYTSDLNPEKERWDLPPRIAMDKILHRDEDPAPPWLIDDCVRAELPEEQGNLIRNKYGD